MDQSTTAADASWVERTTAKGTGARRIFLRGAAPRLAWDLRCQTETARCTWRERETTQSVPMADMLHVEAVAAVPGATLLVAEPPAVAPTAAPQFTGYRWSQLAGLSGTRRASNPVKIGGAVLLSIGGPTALLCSLSIGASFIPVPLVGRVSTDDTVAGFGVCAGAGLTLAILGGAIMLSAPDQADK